MNKPPIVEKYVSQRGVHDLSMVTFYGAMAMSLVVQYDAVPFIYGGAIGMLVTREIPDYPGEGDE